MNDSRSQKKSNYLNINFCTNTFVGFDQKEIENTSDEDLLAIRDAIFSYLTNVKLKKRNRNFKSAFFRINKELKKRERDITLRKKGKEIMKSSKSKLNSETNSQKSKCSSSPRKIIDVVFPSFLNDKRKIQNVVGINQTQNDYIQSVNIPFIPCECNNCQIKKLIDSSLKLINEFKSNNFEVPFTNDYKGLNDMNIWDLNGIGELDAAINYSTKNLREYDFGTNFSNFDNKDNILNLK